MALRADQQDYRQAFRKHCHAYSNWNATGSIISRQLIMIYCIECGLKYLLMRQEGIYQVSDARSDIQSVLQSHDFLLLLKKIGCSEYHFPAIRTKYNEPINPAAYHQVCRYALAPLNDSLGRLRQYDAELKRIVEWLKTRV